MSTSTTAAPPPVDSLFRWIETQEDALAGAAGHASWGRVLDAGTGRHSLRWLTRLAPQLTEIVAVTGEKPLAEELQREFAAAGDEGAYSLQVHAGNWLDPQFLADEAPFDVIVADYLVGSIEGFAPYFQDEIFDRLKPLLAPHGRMYIVGLEPLTETQPATGTVAAQPPPCRCCAAPTDDDAALVQDMARLRDACILLAGRRCYREFPLTWTQKQLEKSGFRVCDAVQMTNVYTMDTIQRQLNVARRQLKWFQDETLAVSMETAIQTFETRVRAALGGGTRKIRFGFDYVVAATLAN